MQMVTTSHPLAAEAGMEALDAGGTAADAAVACAAVLSVVDPGATGIGGDLFAMFWPSGANAPEGLAAAGPAAEALSVESLREAGFVEMPRGGPWTVTVPGAVAGWEVLLRRFGKLGFNRVIDPAIRAADRGFAVTPAVSSNWALAASEFGPEAATIFLPEGRAPKAGERFSNPPLARCLETVVERGARGFYQGIAAERIEATVAHAGGPLRAADLRSWSGPEWVRPMSRRYSGVDIYELPPPSQSLVVLQSLGIAERIAVDDDVDRHHVGIESLKLALADARAYIADPAINEVPIAALLSDEYLLSRSEAINLETASEATAGQPGDTVYVAVVDRDGAACSLMQSVFDNFGSKLVVPEFGIMLQNRGAGFVLDDSHPNSPAPGKRPYHTIIPAMLGRRDAFFACLGMVGGLMQPQGQLQLIQNVLDLGMSPQAAIDAPRWRWVSGRRVGFEKGFNRRVVEGLAARGHEVSDLRAREAGGAQMILQSRGRLLGGSDPRKDGRVFAD